MDEIDELKKVKRVLIIKNVFLIITTLLLIWIELKNNLNLKNQIDFEIKRKIMIVSILIYFVGEFILIVLPDLIKFIILKKRYSNKKTIDITSMKNITREISNQYTPAICSFLYNKKVESYSDYTATILYLESKNHIKVAKGDNGYFIKVINDDIENLSEHEKYTFECIIRKYKFSMDMFKYYVIKDAINLGLAKQKILNTNNSLNLRSVLFLILFIIVIVLTFTLGEDYGALIILLAFAIYIPLGAISKDTKEILTKKGKKVRYQVMGLKSFIREYTLLKERSIEYKELFGNYIAYALSLGEADVVNEFVKENEQYRDLIYNKKK